MTEGFHLYAYVLVKLMNKTGMSFNQVAMGAGISYQKVMQIVSGDSTRISLDTVKKIEELATKVARGEE